ncbi:hypothetical protein [Siphonobacter sp. BAB-5405]|nr:hypothetical protein [Siphonobacter sp. BAB-5405]
MSIPFWAIPWRQLNDLRQPQRGGPGVGCRQAWRGPAWKAHVLLASQ